MTRGLMYYVGRLGRRNPTAAAAPAVEQDRPWPLDPLIRGLTVTDLGRLMQMKVELVESCAGTRSLRDFGGLYLVHGKYLLEPAVTLGAAFASMIDITPLAEFDERIADARTRLPDLEVEFVHADFRDTGLYGRLRPVDTSILFEVLLHQENYVGVLQQVAGRTDRYICIAQPCIKEARLGLPGSATLLQFWPESLKDAYRAAHWPKEPSTQRFESAYWMWGHTVSHLIAVMGGIGWRVSGGSLVDTVYGPHWDYALLRFERD